MCSTSPGFLCSVPVDSMSVSRRRWRVIAGEGGRTLATDHSVPWHWPDVASVMPMTGLSHSISLTHTTWEYHDRLSDRPLLRITGCGRFWCSKAGNSANLILYDERAMVGIWRQMKVVRLLEHFCKNLGDGKCISNSLLQVAVFVGKCCPIEWRRLQYSSPHIFHGGAISISFIPWMNLSGTMMFSTPKTIGVIEIE